MSKNLRIFSIAALLGIIGISLFYFLTLYLITKNFWHPWNQFLILQPWMSLLIIGFGLQTGIYWLLRSGIQIHLSSKQQNKVSVASGSSVVVSASSMAACCAHHIIDVLPLLGLSGLSFFFVQYQIQLLIAGVLINAVSLIFMTWILFAKPTWRQIIINFSKNKYGLQ